MAKYSIRKLPSDILLLTAQKIAVLRKEQGLTQEELSKKSDVSYGSIKRFERSGKISFESLLKISEALGKLPEFENILHAPLESKKIKALFNS